MLSTGVVGSAELADTGAMLAMRALGWGTVCAITGTSLFCYGFWKLSGAKDVSLKILYIYSKSYISLILELFICSSKNLG